MKNAFSANLILRQIRKHPETMPKIKAIPSEYLFLDKRHGDESLDSQTDIGTPIFSSSKLDENENENDKKEETEADDMKNKKKGEDEDEDEATQTEKYVKNVETLKNLMTDYLSGSSVATSVKSVASKPKKAPRKKGGSEDTTTTTTNNNNNNMTVTPTILGSLLGETVVSSSAAAPTKKPSTPRKRAAPAAAKKAAATATDTNAAITALTAK